MERWIDGELEAHRRSVGGGGVPGSGVGEMAKGRGERVEGVLVVPMRARDRALGISPRRRRGGGRRALGAAWQEEERTRREAKAAVRARARRVGKLRSRRWPWRRPRAAAVLNSGGVKQRSRQEEGEGGVICNFRKFQGPNCKSSITFKPRLKWKSAQHESCSLFEDLQLGCCAKIYLIRD